MYWIYNHVFYWLCVCVCVFARIGPLHFNIPFQHWGWFQEVKILNWRIIGYLIIVVINSWYFPELLVITGKKKKKKH